MQKMTKLKRFFVILLSVVMFTSPILFSGCGLEDDFKRITKDPLDFETHYGGGGGGSGSEPDTTDPNIPLPENELSFDDYDDYFKNYRLTYKPGEVERESFNQSIKDQNQSISQSILEKLFEQYGNSGNELFTEEIANIIIENNQYIAYQNQEDEYSIIGLRTDESLTKFNHNNAINGGNNSEVKKWNFSTDGGIVDQDAFNSDIYKRKIQLASALILSGNYIDSEDSEKNTFNNLYAPYKDAETIEDSVIDEYVSQVNHLGWTDVEIKQLASFILNYVIGEDLVAEDNNRFVNAYCDVNGDLKIVYYGADNNLKNSRYNRFLTDETYATGMFYNGNFVFNVVDEYGESENSNLEGLLYYAGEYLKTASKNNFDQTEKFKNISFSGLITEYAIDDFLDGSSVSPNVDKGVSDQAFGQAIYNKLIATDYRTTEIKDEYNNVIDTKYNFNANVWGYDRYGEIQGSEYFDEPEREVEKNNVMYIAGAYNHVLFSVRLPYFKNYYNTVHFMVRDMLLQEVTDENRADLDAEWNANHPNMDSYPYSEVFPTVPLTYFADYDNTDMLFDNVSVTHMFSGYQAYQSMVIMPQKDLFLEEAALFFVREPLENEFFDQNVNGDFELTIYARYYDAATQSYATWGNNGSEFYLVETITVTCEPLLNNGRLVSVVPIVVHMSIKDILSSAKINGTERNSYLLNAFSEDEEVLTHQAQLLSKDNYGWWFKQDTTPQGDEVVCFDGQSVGTQSYLEFVISNKTNSPFQFCFYPTICYSTQTNQ